MDSSNIVQCGRRTIERLRRANVDGLSLDISAWHSKASTCRLRSRRFSRSYISCPIITEQGVWARTLAIDLVSIVGALERPTTDARK